ncbi:hypothetical protein IFT64_16135 [Oxalobacteraceae sp. CFBP 8753]|nr:hypothetical protein [Oxalobacteraceae sp. CFBP 8753]
MTGAKSRVASRQRSPSPSVVMVAIGEIRHEYATKAKALRTEQAVLDKRRQLLGKINFEAMPPEKLIEHFHDQDKANLVAILGLPAGTPAAELSLGIRRVGSHRVASLIRREPIQYDEVARDMAKKLGVVDLSSKATVFELEQRIVGAVAQKMVEKATPAEKQAVLVEFSKGSASNGGFVVAGGGLALAHLSGFGLYTAASTSLAAVSGAVGLTLPFAAYTGMSSTLAALTGPIGWTLLAAVATYKLFGPDTKIAIAAVLCMAAGRARRIADHQAEVETLNGLARLHELHADRLARLRWFLDQHAQLADNQAIPKSNVPTA